MQFTRRVWIAAVCTFSLLAVAPVAQAQPTKLLPNDTELMLTFNLQQILNSDVLKTDQSKLLLEIVKAKLNEGLDDKGISKYLKSADFDLYKDLHSVTFAYPGGRGPEEGMIILEGTFDGEKITAAAAEATKEAGGKLTVSEEGKGHAFEVTGKGDKTIYVGVFNKKTMVLCNSKDDFLEAAARASSNKAPKFKSAVFKNLLETINGKQSVTFAGTSNAMLKAAEKIPERLVNEKTKQATDFLKTLDGFSAAITIDKDIDFQLGVNTVDNETATKYAGLTTIGVGVAKAKIAEQAKKDERFAPVVDVINTIKIQAKSSNLLIRGQVTFDSLQKLMELLPTPNN